MIIVKRVFKTTMKQEKKGCVLMLTAEAFGIFSCEKKALPNIADTTLSPKQST